VAKTRDEIITKAREIMGLGTSKGGLADTSLQADLNDTIDRFCLLSEALQTVFNLDTKAGSKYVPLHKEVLWVKSAHFVPASGHRYPLDLLSGMPDPGLSGDPLGYWLTAVNIPDETGPSTRVLGLEPIPTWDGIGAVQIECFQVARPLAAGSETPEILDSYHQYLSWGLVEDWCPTHKDKQYLLPQAHARFMEGVKAFSRLAAPDRKVVVMDKDVMRYRQLARRRFS
jgi:hypothetical protein